MSKSKVESDLNFYFWIGCVLYGTNTVLYVVDFAQRYGWDPVGYAAYGFYFLVSFLPILYIKRMQNWARNLFILKFIVFVMIFYPQMIYLKGGSWMYSHHFPHGVFQRISNFGDVAFELFMVIHLFKRSVRMEFRG